MPKKNPYRATHVNKVSVEKLIAAHPDVKKIYIGVDIGKKELFATVCWGEGASDRPWQIKSRTEIAAFVERVKCLQEHYEVVVAMESTGTYGDPLRQALADAEVPVQQVPTQSVKAFAKVHDGTDSKHDRKDPGVIAELARIGKGIPWDFEPADDFDVELKLLVDQLESHDQFAAVWLGKTEAWLARHWPEASLALSASSVTLMNVLAHFGSPQALADADPGEAEKLLRQWGKNFLSEDKIDNLLNSANRTVGVRPTAMEVKTVQLFARHYLEEHQRILDLKRAVAKHAKGHEKIEALGEVVGIATACVLWICLGDPANYHCAEAYRKAMGLNLKERASGKYQGLLKITKRGSAKARRWLYFAALRKIKDTECVDQWYKKKKKNDGARRGKIGVVAVMRKLALALYHIGNGEQYDERKLFPGCPLSQLKPRVFRIGGLTGNWSPTSL